MKIAKCSFQPALWPSYAEKEAFSYTYQDCAAGRCCTFHIILCLPRTCILDRKSPKLEMTVGGMYCVGPGVEGVPVGGWVYGPGVGAVPLVPAPL